MLWLIVVLLSAQWSDFPHGYNPKIHYVQLHIFYLESLMFELITLKIILKKKKKQCLPSFTYHLIQVLNAALLRIMKTF